MKYEKERNEKKVQIAKSYKAKDNEIVNVNYNTDDISIEELEKKVESITLL